MSAQIKQKIKSIRELKNYTQEYMADKLEISQAAYSKIEKGPTDLSLRKLEKIASIFDVPMENIIQFENHFVQEKTNNEDLKNKIDNEADVKKITGLYKDKIMLLEKLLSKTDSELKRYRDKFGIF
ncbi:helix-turn-helix transcriptional regulator [Flavobacterium gelatinilyticum]|uniref:helix-turn-helix transcriptional regulator n=1 Tax=Flavobacterium gelatinilyticum TaxID=3003260 RepID=UPI00248141D1|nr:helix-turn-helix domain-containing protein [Flavobacterium gelatinilyticum]